MLMPLVTVKKISALRDAPKPKIGAEIHVLGFRFHHVFVLCASSCNSACRGCSGQAFTRRDATSPGCSQESLAYNDCIKS